MTDTLSANVLSTGRPPLRLDLLYAPSSIAVVGASPKPGKRGRTLIDNLTWAGYPGEILPVNPNYEEVLGLACFPSLADLPTTPDVAAICLPSMGAVTALQECAKLAIPAAAVVAGGFAESGPQGAALQDSLRMIALSHGITLAGPNALGVINRATRVCYWAGLRYAEIPSGIGAVVQSGALALSLMSMLFERKIFLDSLAMPGNEAVVTASDHLAYLIEQPDIRVVALLLDGIRDASGFVASARRAADLRKHIVVLKVGRSEGGRKAAAAHTASLTGSDATFDAVCRDLGLVRVDDVDELLEATILASRVDIPAEPRVLVTSVSGAGCGVVSDLAARAGIVLPPPSSEAATALNAVLPGAIASNPLDVALAFDLPGSYRSGVGALGQSGEYNMQLTVLNCPRANDDNQEFDRSQVEDAAAISAQQTRPLVISSFASGQYDASVLDTAASYGIPVLQGLRESLLSIRRLAEAAAQIEERARSTRSAVPDRRVAPSSRIALSDVPQLLGNYGIRLPRRVLVRSRTDVAAACGRVGYPIVLKVASPDVLHKTDVGGLLLGIGDAAGAEAAWDQIASSVARAAPDARIEGLWVEEMVPGVAELILGAQHDPQFGPVLVVGAGGVLVEALQDFALAIPPVSTARAGALLRSLRTYRVLTGFRGRPAADVDAAVNAIVRFSSLVSDHAGRFQSFELNPLVVGREGHGAVAVDYLITQPPAEI